MLLQNPLQRSPLCYLRDSQSPPEAGASSGDVFSKQDHVSVCLPQGACRQPGRHGGLRQGRDGEPVWKSGYDSVITSFVI